MKGMSDGRMDDLGDNFWVTFSIFYALKKNSAEMKICRFVGTLFLSLCFLCLFGWHLPYLFLFISFSIYLFVFIFFFLPLSLTFFVFILMYFTFILTSLPLCPSPCVYVSFFLSLYSYFSLSLSFIIALTNICLFLLSLFLAPSLSLFVYHPFLFSVTWLDYYSNT